MIILWLCNIILPRIAREIGAEERPIGGWLTGMSDALLQDETIHLYIFFPHTAKIEGRQKNLHWYGFHEVDVRSYFSEKIKEIRPDLIHIHGTEFQHSLLMIQAAQKNGLLDYTVVSIQGLVSIYGKYHYFLGLPHRVVKAWTFRDLLRWDNIYRGGKKYVKRGVFEEEALRLVKNIVGRTEWDRACTKRLNPAGRYFFCNETLRNSFYRYQWKVKKCQRYSIFVSQSQYPIKGFHFVLLALREIVKSYPDAVVYTTGKSAVDTPWYRVNSYQKYIMRLIKKFSLEDHVVFLGSLDESRMCNRFLSSHVFISASSIENSSNSLGEAMLLGMPIVASYVGGTMDLLRDKEEGFLYQTDAPYMLAYYVMRFFADDALCMRMGSSARKHAKVTFDRDRNNQRIKEIYQTILAGDTGNGDCSFGSERSI